MSRSAPSSRPGRSSSSLLLQQMKARVAAGAGIGREDEALDLFSRNRRSLPVATEKGSEGVLKLGSISVGAAKPARGDVEDFLSNADTGKNDYDWLLTPPGTPLRSTLEVTEPQPPSENSSSKSVFATKTSRFSASQTENSSSMKQGRSSLVTRPSVSFSHSSNLSNNKTSILNTSSSSITSHRPSTPTKRSAAITGTKQPTVPTSRTIPARSSIPVKTHPTGSAGDKCRPSNGTRSSTPTGRSQVSTNLHSSSNTNPLVARPNSRSSTPTRRTSAPASARPSTPTRRTPASAAPVSTRPSTPPRSASTSSSVPVSARPSTPTRRIAAPSAVPVSTRPSTPTRRTPAPSAPPHTRSSSVGRASTASSRNVGSGSSSRPSSPNARVPTPQIHVGLDFSVDAPPPNLRTKMPERPASAGRTRPGVPLIARVNVNAEAPRAANPPRRQSSPARGRLPDSSRAKVPSNGHETIPSEIQKAAVSEGAGRKSGKPANAQESTGFGRTISKKSLDMALRHMDIRQGMGGIRGASLFPQSIRSSAAKGRTARKSDPVYPTSRDGTDTEDNDCGASISGSYTGGISETGESITTSPDREFLMKKATDPDMFESSRYDSLLLKEDTKSMNWLHSIEDKLDQSPVFDHRFEQPPEPFTLP